MLHVFTAMESLEGYEEKYCLGKEIVFWGNQNNVFSHVLSGALYNLQTWTGDKNIVISYIDENVDDHKNKS